MITGSEEYLIGIPSIDKQHKHYIELINKLLVAHDAGNMTKSELVDYVNSIIAYGLEHLDTEEFLMRSEKYPFYEEHLAKHNVFRDKMDKFLEEIETQDVDINEYINRLCDCLIMWFKTELLRDDIVLAQFLKDKGVE